MQLPIPLSWCKRASKALGKKKNPTNKKLWIQALICKSLHIKAKAKHTMNSIVIVYSYLCILVVKLSRPRAWEWVKRHSPSKTSRPLYLTRCHPQQYNQCMPEISSFISSTLPFHIHKTKLPWQHKHEHRTSHPLSHHRVAGFRHINGCVR